MSLEAAGQGAVGGAGDVDRFEAPAALLAGEDGEVAPYFRGQATARREGPRQQEVAAAHDAELGPVLASRDDGRRRVGWHGGRGGGRGQPERPRRQPGELEAGGLTQLLIGGEQLAAEGQHQGPPFAAAIADRGVVEDDFIGRLGQLLEGLEADDGWLFRLGDGGVVNFLEDDPVTADARQDGGGGDAGLLEALLEEAAELFGVGRVG